MKNLLQRVLGIQSVSDLTIRKQFGREIDRAISNGSNEQPTETAEPEGEPKEQSAQPVSKQAGRVIFTVAESGEVSIQMMWTSLTNEVAEALGALLFCINTGKLSEQCEALLNQTAQKDPKSRKFIELTGESWSKRLKSNEQTVRPSEVFQVGRQILTRPDHCGKGRAEVGETEE